MQKREKVILFIFFIFCISIRLFYISQKNLWFDEIFSWNLTLDSFYTIIVRTSNDVHPPLYYFILKIWNYLLDDSVFSMRAFSALCGSLSVFFIYPISRKILKPLESIIVVVLYCISPLNLYYSQEVRMSAMNLLFNIISVYYFIKLVESKSGIKDIFRDKYSYLYILFTTLALYTHYFSFFILITQIIFLLYYFKKNINNIKSFGLIYISILILYIVWLPEFISQISRGQSWRSPQNASQVIQELLHYLKDVSLGLYYHFTNLQLVYYITYFLILMIILCIVGLFIKKEKNNGNFTILTNFLVLIPLSLTIIISFSEKIEFFRYLSILVPYILIFIVYSLNKYKFKIIPVTIIILYASVNIFGVWLYFTSDFKNDDYRALITTLNANYSEGERIYVEPHYNGWSINYYKKQENLKIPNIVDNRYGWDNLMDSLNTQKPKQFWLIMDYGSVDTTKYPIYLSDMKALYEQTYFQSFPDYPVRVDLYRFSLK